MKLEGDVAELDLVDRLVELGRDQFTGAIRFENDGVIKILYFKGGDILSASTNDRADSVDEILLRAGKVSRDHVKQALAKRKESETLGDALLTLGFITRKELTWARRVQAIGVIRSIIGWDDGTYTVVADYLPKREEGTLFPLQQVVVEVIVTDQDRPKFERLLDSGEVVFSKTDPFEELFRRLGLNEEAEEIAAQIDGNQTAAEIASASGKDEFNVYKLLFALEKLGYLSRQTKPQGSLHVLNEGAVVDEFAAAGVADAADAWSAPQADGAGFQFEDEVPVPPAAVVQPEPTVPAESGDELPESEDLELPSEIPPERPAWGGAVPAAAQSATPSPPKAGGDDWGFDQAQVETARRASPAPAPRTLNRPSPMKSKRRRSLMPLYVILLLGVIGGGAWLAWIKLREPRSESPAAPNANAAGPGSSSVTTSVVAPGVGASATTGTGASASGSFPPVSPSETTTPAAATTTRTTTSTTTTTTTRAAVKEPAKEPSRAPAPARPGTAVASDATRAHYDEMAREFQQIAGGNFTVQFELVCQTASLQRALNAGRREVWFVPTSYRGQSCYRLLWGRYATRQQADAATTQIPPSIRGGSKPVVVSIPRP